MKTITVKVTDAQAEYLGWVGHMDSPLNKSETVRWCIDACMGIHSQGVDPCGLSFDGEWQPDVADDYYGRLRLESLREEGFFDALDSFKLKIGLTI